MQRMLLQSPQAGCHEEARWRPTHVNILQLQCMPKTFLNPTCSEATPVVSAQVAAMLLWDSLWPTYLFSVVVKNAEEKHRVDEQIRGKIELDTFSRSWSCRQCGYSNSRKEVVYKHVDTKHMEVVYRCDNCQRLVPTQHALKEHTRTYHKDAPVISSYSGH